MQKNWTTYNAKELIQTTYNAKELIQTAESLTHNLNI